jgi:hypothetical protein
MDMLPIFTIGDSHAVWSFAIDGLKYPRVAHSIRIATPYSWTMHRVGRDNTDFTALGLPKESIMLLSFGWIDINFQHIDKQITLGRNLDEIIDTLVNAYINVLIQNRNRGQKYIGVMNVIPPTTDDDKTIFTEALPDGPSSIEIRVLFTKKMNFLLKQKCSEFNLLYLNLHDAYVNEDGSLKKDLSDGNVHLRTFVHHDKCFDEMISSYTARI